MKKNGGPTEAGPPLLPSKNQTWNDVIRPALSDRLGRALFIGTPQGCNHFFDTYERALTAIDWAAFHFTTAQGQVISAAELENMARDMSPESYRREILAQFTSLSDNRVYEDFNRGEHVKPLRFDPLRDPVWAIDFNVNPMCMLLIQKIEDITHVLHEIVIKPNATTAKACDVFFEQARVLGQQVPMYQRPLIINIYGDASGNQKRTSGAQTDWAIIKDSFSKWVGTFVPFFFTNTSIPFVKDRVNCVTPACATTSAIPASSSTRNAKSSSAIFNESPGPPPTKSISPTPPAPTRVTLLATSLPKPSP